MTEEVKKTRGPRRSHAEIAADYEAKAKAAAQKAKLASTPGLKTALEVQHLLAKLVAETDGGKQAASAKGLFVNVTSLVTELSK